MRKQLSTAFIYWLAAIVLTWPAATALGDVVPGSPGTDLWNSLWSLNHWADSLLGGHLPWRVDALDFPSGGSLLVSDPLGATLVFPLVGLFGVSTAYTCLVWFQLTLSGFIVHRFAAEYLVWRRGSGKVGHGPWVSGLTFMTAPLIASHIHNGATEALSSGFTALAVWMLWRSAVLPSVRNIVTAGLALTLAGLAHGYGGVVAGVFAVAIAILGVGDGTPRYALRRWLPVLLGCLLTAGIFGAMNSVHQADDALLEIKSAQQVSDALRSTGSADPLTYVLPGAHRSPDFREVSKHDERFMHVHYLGFVLIGLSVWACIRRRRHTGVFVLGGLVCMVLSLGPVLMRSARPVLFSGDMAVPLPFLLLEYSPILEMMSLPWKLALGPVLAVSMLAGLALDLRGRRLALAAVALCCVEARMLSPAAEIPGVVSTAPEASIVALRSAPEGAVINYPLQPGRPYLAEQVIHGKPIAGMLNQVANTQAMRLWGRIRTESQSDPDTFHRAVSSTAERLGIRYLVIHADPDAEPDVYSQAVIELERLFGVPEWGRGQTRVVPLW